MANKALKEARKAYSKNKNTKYTWKDGKKTEKKKQKKKEKSVASSYGQVEKKTQTVGSQGKENRQNASVKKAASSVKKSVTPSRSGAVSPVSSHYGNVSNKSNDRTFTNKKWTVTDVANKVKETANVHSGANNKYDKKKPTTVSSHFGQIANKTQELGKKHSKKVGYDDSDVKDYIGENGTAKGTEAGKAFNRHKTADDALKKEGEKKVTTTKNASLLYGIDAAIQKAGYMSKQPAEAAKFYDEEEKKAQKEGMTYGDKKEFIRKWVSDKSNKEVLDAIDEYKNQKIKDSSYTYTKAPTSTGDFFIRENASKYATNRTKTETNQPVYQTDKDGNIKYDKNGKPKVKKDKNGNVVYQKIDSNQGNNILDYYGGGFDKNGRLKNQNASTEVGNQTAGWIHDAPVAAGVMQGLSYSDITRGLGNYSNAAAKDLQKTKESGAFNVGYMAGQAGQFMLGGTAKMTDALVKGVAKTGATRSALNVGLRKGAADIAFETPLNTLDALKMSTDANGNFDKKAFIKYMALNTGLSGGMGGVIGGVGAKMTKSDVRKFAELSEKLNKNIELSPSEVTQYNALKSKMDSALESGDRVKEDYVNAWKEDVQIAKAKVEENRLARRLGAKGLSPEEIQKAVSKKEVQEWIDLSVKEGKGGLTVEQQKHLDRLSAKVEAQKKAYDQAITESVKATRASIGKASAIDVARLRRAVTHYDMTGQTALAKEARKLLKQAEKNLDGTLDTVTKAAANVSDAIKRDFKIESAEECISAFGKTGGRVSDPSQFHGFAEFDKNGNIVGYHVNKDSEQALEFTFGHEFMHGFESLGKDYDDFVTDLKTFVGDEWDEAVEIARRDYANVANADYEKEAVANLVAKHFFSEDSTYLKKLAGENPSMFAKVYDFIKKLLKGVDEHDVQFEALSKRMDEMFESLSTQQKSIIKGSPDTTEMLFGSVKSATKSKDPSVMGNYYKAIKRLEEAERKYADDYMQLAEARRQIFKDTMWFQGVDGKWRYEISDAAMKWTGKMNFATSTMRNKNRTNIVFRDTNTGKITIDEDMATSYLKEKGEIEHRLETEKLNKTQRAELERRHSTLESNLKRYYLFSKDGLPIGEVLNHSAFYKMFPDAKDPVTGIHIRFGELDGNNPAELIGRKIDGKTHPDSMLVLNRDYFNPNSDFYRNRIERGEHPESEMMQSIVHELQHYIQAKDELSKGTAMEQFAEEASDNIYPKVYDRDADKLNEINTTKENYLDKLYEIDGSATDDFVNYLKEIKGQKIIGEDKQLGYTLFGDYKPNAQIEKLYNSGDKNAYANFVATLLVKKYKFKIPSAEYKKYLANYLYRDFDAAQLAERDVRKIYDTTLGEMEARQVEERLFENGQAYSKDSHKLTKEERSELFPMDDFEGKNVRYNEYHQASSKIDDELPDRFTAETGFVKDSGGRAEEVEQPVSKTERSQTMSESEASYYNNLASDVESAEKELQDAMDAYTSNAPKKGQMTDEVRAQVKAQNLGGKELTDAQVDTLAEAQVALHNQKVIIPESARTGTVKQIRANHGIDEDNVMLPIVKSETAKNAQSVGDAYATMSKEYPDLFPSSITDEAEQFQRLMDVSGLKGGAASRRGNYYVPKNRTMTPYKPKAKTEKVAKVDKAETAEAPKEKPPEQPKQTEQKVEKSTPKEQNPTPKETPTEKNGVIERERRDDTKKRENDTAKRAFDTLNKEYGKDQGWVDAVTGKREDGAFGKLKVKGAKEAEATVNKEFDKLGYDKLKNEYFKAEVADDPYVAMARANKLLGEIDRKLKAGEGEASALYDEATDIIEKYSGITSLGSNILSSAKKFLTSTPQGRKRVVLKEIERLEKRYKDRIKGGKIQIDEAKIDELMQASGARADDLLDEINKEIWEQIPASLMERMNEYRHCFMLFNVKTHGRNVLGNSVFRMARAVSDDMEQRILNSNAARKRIGKMQGKDPSEVIINKQKVTHKELKDNYTYLFNEFHTIYDKSGSRNKFIETGRPDGVDTVKFKLMQKLINFNYAALEKEDLKGSLIPAFNKAYLGYCKARCPKDVDLRKFMEEMTPAQKEKAQRYALAQGEYATFRDSCALSDWLTAKKTTFAGQKGKTKWGTFGYRALDTVLEGALPFVKTPVNIFRRSVDYSPASLIMSIGKLAKADSPEMFQLGVHQLCTGLTGTGMAGLGVFLAQQGLITVKAGEESGDAYYDRDMGYQDYSLKINLGDKQYSWTLDWMSPMNMSLFAGAAFQKFFDKEGFDNTAALNAFFAITSPMTDMSFMSSPKDTMERFLENASRGADGKETDFAGALAQLIVGDVPKNYVSGFFPQLMSQFAGATDEYRRDTKSTRENVYLRGWESAYRQLVNKVPWARQALLNPKLNRRGEDVKNDENIATRLINSFFNPANVKEITMNDEDRELINIRNNITDKTSNLYKYFYYNFTGNPPYDLANGKRMTYDESYKYAKASRAEQNINIKNMLGADSYKGMTWDMKANEVDGAYWIGKSVADHDTYGVNYALKVLKNDSHGKRDYNTWTTYKDNAGGSANKETFWNYHVDKERLYNRAHPNGDNTYRVKGLPAIQSGDQALIDAVGLTGQKEPELKHYWEKAQKKYGKKAKEITNKKISDAVCIMTTNIDKAGVEAVGLGMQSASAAVSAKNGKKIDQDEYRALGQFWNSAQAGGGLQLKYNKDGKYDLKNLEKYSKQLDKKLDNRPDGVSQKDVACDFIENDLGITNVDEAACVFQVLYLQGHSNPASKNSWKNPYKDQIDDHLEWGENKDGEWGGKTKGSGGGRGRRGWRRGHGGGGGGSKKGTAPKTDTGAIKGKVTDPFGSSNGTKSSNLNDAYRKRARKLRESTNK